MILADTHAWLWWVAGDRALSKRAKQRMDAADEIGISVISCWELAMLVARGRVRLDRDVLVWIQQSLSSGKLTLVPLSAPIAVAATRLEDLHGDPADRIIAATAQVLKLPLVTKDERLRSWRGVPTVW